MEKKLDDQIQEEFLFEYLFWVSVFLHSKSKTWRWSSFFVVLSLLVSVP